MNIKKELLSHLILEFSDSKHALNEKRGRIESIDQIVDCLCNKMRKQINRVISNKDSETKTYTGKLEDDGIHTFFNEYTIVLTINYERSTTPGSMANYSGGLTPATSFSNISDGETGEFVSVKCHPYIWLTIDGLTFSDIFYTLRFSIGHELTHAYNLYHFGNKNHRTVDGIIANYMYGQGYRNIRKAKAEKTGNPQAVATLLYLLNRMERNAYISQLRQEIVDHKDEIRDAQSAADVIMNSQSFRKFKVIKNDVLAICNPAMSEASREEILNATNEIAGQRFTTYNQVKKFYLRLWEKWRKKYIITASKIAKDVYDENIFDGSDDLTSKDISIKIK